MHYAKNTVVFIMGKLNIEYKISGTGMYSPWHLEIARKHDVNLIVTSDTGCFIKVGEDVYKLLRPRDMYKLYEYITTIEKMNEDGDITDEETLTEINDIFNNKNKDFTLEKCESLDEFEERILKLK